MAEETSVPGNEPRQSESAGTLPASVPNQKSGDPGAEGLPRIRTYAADMNRAIRTRGETLSSIITAEKKRRTQKRPSEEEAGRTVQQRTLLALGAAFLVLLGITVVASAMFFLGGKNEPPPLTQGLIFANRTVTVSLSSGERLTERLDALRTNENLSLGEVARVVAFENGVKLPPLETALQLGLPAAFAREVGEIMVGIHAFDRNQPFILMTVSAFDRSYGALLSNEPELGRDLGAFFAPHGADGDAPSLSFKDAILRNIDVRQSSDPSWPILYAYPARTTVIITTNEFTLREIVTRLGNTGR